jgi:Carboxypeptidase regulatory-like domain/TonB dependent receptor/TonB-dependent Receptor Plug Domain
MIRKLALSGAIAIYLLVSSQLAIGQGPTTGRIEGTVRDPNGAIVPNAEVRILNTTTGTEWALRSDGAGHYLAVLLPPGLYRITITAPGLASPQADPVRVHITQSAVADVTLTVTGQAITVPVESSVQSNGPELGRLVDARTINELPLSTRNFTQVLSLSPGAVTYLPDSTGVGRNTQTISVNGARMTQNNVQINGIDANTMGTSAAINVAAPAPESIQEFKVQTSLYDASFGRSGGANVQLITRSGGNDFHGTAYEYFRNEALNANNPFLKAAGVSRPVLKRNAFGGTVGGPIKRDKAFFFASYQGTREKNGASILNSLSSGVLLDSSLTDDRSEATLKKNFGLPSIHPTALALLNEKTPEGQFLIPTPQANGRYFGSAISRFTENQMNANVDYRLSDKNWLTSKLFLANAPFFLQLPSFRGTGANVPGFGTDQAANVRVLVIQDVHSFSPRTFNELRLGYNTHRNYISPLEPVNDSEVGITRSNAGVFPGLGLIRIAAAAGGVVLGTPTNISPAFASVTTVTDTFAISRGDQLIRIGGEFRFNEVLLAQEQFTRGQVDFANFRSFLTGISVNSTLGDGIGNRKQRAFDYNFFFQDDWKLSDGLTLDLGLRYELDLPVYDTRGRISTFDPQLYRPPPDTSGPPSGGFVQAGNVIPQYDLSNVPNVGRYVIHTIDANNFGPRIGLAYALLDSARVVVRAGYGIFHSRPTFQYVSTSVTTPPGYLLGRQSDAPLDHPYITLPEKFPTLVSGVPLTGTVPDRGIRTPYFHQYNGSVQFEIARQTVLEAAYVGTRGVNLFRQVAINQSRLASPTHPIVNGVTGEIITTNTPQPQNVRARSPFQGVDINSFFVNQTTAQSSYNSFQLSLTRRFAQGLQFLTSYTYAKSIDNASGSGGGAGIVGIVNPGAVADTSSILGNQFDIRANRGVSDFDRTHRLVLSYVWDLPRLSFASRSRFTRQLLWNWETTGIVTAMSGLPIDVVDSGAGSLYGLSGGANPLARPSWVPGQTRASATQNIPAGYFFNPFVFVRPAVPAGQLIPSSNGTAKADATGTDIGNVGRNILRGPHQSNIDISLIKRFVIRESRTLEFHFDAFNLLNHVNLANPISDFNAVVPTGSIDINKGTISNNNAGAFGRIISTSNNPRIIQLAVKFSF